MNAPVRLIEPILGVDAYERPTREDIAAFWAEGCRLPIPDYPREALKRLPPLEDPWTVSKPC